MSKREVTMDGENVDPNPTRGRTFILGEGYTPTEQELSTPIDQQKQMAAIVGLMELYPDLTEDDILDFY
jgi:hypothetical protein